MTNNKCLIKQSSYFFYIFWGCFSFITFILILVSMGLWQQKNANIDLLVPALHVISQIIAIIGIVYNGSKLIYQFNIQKIKNLSFYSFIFGIIIVLSSIAIGISSIFIIKNHNMLWNGINLIWVVLLFINLIVVFICYKKDQKANIIQDFDISEEHTNNKFDDNYILNRNRYNNEQDIDMKELLRKKDFNLLILFCSFIFLLIICYIVLFLFFKYVPFDNFYRTEITKNGSTLQTITGYGYGIIMISAFTGFSCLAMVIGANIMYWKIHKKIKLFEINANVGCNKFFKIFLIINLICFISTFALGLIFGQLANLIDLNKIIITTIATIILILILMFLISAIVMFVLSINLKKWAINLNYFQKSLDYVQNQINYDNYNNPNSY